MNKNRLNIILNRIKHNFHKFLQNAVKATCRNATHVIMGGDCTYSRLVVNSV